MNLKSISDTGYENLLNCYNNCAKTFGLPLKSMGDFITVNEMLEITNKMFNLNKPYTVVGDYYGWGPLPCETIDLSNERAWN